MVVSGLSIGLTIEDMRCMPVGVLANRVAAWNGINSADGDDGPREATEADMGLLL